MSGQKWTMEPWAIDKSYTTMFMIGDAAEVPVAEVQCSWDSVSEQIEPTEEESANASRIVACVNGCKGLNPEAFAECVKALDALGEYGKARPQIGPRCMEPLAKIIDTARKAIANARTVSA